MRSVNDFIGKNTGRWKTPDSEGVVLVEGRPLPGQIVTESLVAKILSDKSYGSPVVVSNRLDKMHMNIFKSFDITDFEATIIRRKLFFKPKLLVSCFLKFVSIGINFLLHKCNFEWFINDLCVKSVNIGDLVYDSHIRSGHNYINPLSNIRRLLGILFNALILVEGISSLFTKYKVRYVLVSTFVYASPGAILTRFALQNNIPVIVVTGTFARILSCYDEARRGIYSLTPDTLKRISKFSKWEQELDSYLHKRFIGDVPQHDAINAYRNKKKYTKNELLEKLFVNTVPEFPVVFIMLHAFSDAPHGSGAILFRDYFDWYMETLEHIKGIKDVLWIVKPHPTSHMYYEEGIAEKFLQPFLSDNIKLCPNDLHTASIFEIANALVTVNGTIGIEAACMGVPVLLAGDSVYGSLGFSYTAKTRDEYFTILTKIGYKSRLSNDQVLCARKALYCYLCNQRPKSDVIPTSYDYMPGQTKEQYEKLFDKFYDDLSKNLESLTFEDDLFYKRVEELIQKGYGVIET